MPPPELRAPSASQNNAELLLYSLLLLGGSERWVDVEELYLRAFSLAPARLSWRTRGDLPDYKKCAKALQELEDPKRSEHAPLIRKRDRYSRKLTMAGLDWCEQFRPLLESLYGTSVGNASSQDDARRIRHIVQSDVFAVWSERRELGAEQWQLAELLRCMPDSPRATWMSRIDEYVVAARRNHRSDVEEFMEAVRTRIEDAR